MSYGNPFERQISNRNFLSPTGFKFTLQRAPKVAFFGNSANLPAISMGTAIQPTYLKDIDRPGDKVDFGDFNYRFLVDENLENYREIHGWMYGLGFPAARTQFANLVSAGRDRFPTSKNSVLGDAGRSKFAAPNTGGIFSDATLNILTSKNNPVTEVRFSDVFPISLSGLQYSQQNNDTDYLTATVTFDYKLYDFADKSASRTTITTS